MNKESILLILDSEGKYKQKRNQYESIDIDKFVNNLKKLNYDVEITSYVEISKNICEIKNRNIVYTASQNPLYKKYIEDIIYVLNKRNFIVPGYESLLGEENKEYQELQRKILKLDDLKSFVVSDISEIEKINFEYPIVIKKPNTSASLGVFLAHDKAELYKIIYKHFIKHDLSYYKLLVKKIIKKLLKHKTRDWTNQLLKDYQYSRIILQEFIPNLDCDFKVLVYGDKYYVLKRNVKNGDFKASGSGLRDFNYKASDRLLNFSKQCFEKLDVPFAGLDIAIDKNGKCYLIEFQSIHIGPVTLIDSDKYYINKNCKWIVNNKKSVLEEEYARAIDLYIRKKVSKNEKK